MRSYPLRTHGLTAQRLVGLLIALPVTLIAALSLGCASTGALRNPTPCSLGRPPSLGQSTLIAGTVVAVRVMDEPEPSGTFRVDERGELTLPFCGTVTAAGITPDELTGRIEACLADGYIRHPSVSVLVEEWGQAVTLRGAVARPGAIPYRVGMTLLGAVALSGGLQRTAARSATLERGGQCYTISLEAIRVGESPDEELLPGDRLLIHEGIL